MATKSIMKNVTIKDRKTARSLATALENAQGKRAKKVVFSRPFSEASRDEIRKMFGETDDRLQTR